MIKICIWMDAPSHYQSAFYKALNEHDDVDLQVCYLKEVSKTRAAQGWSNSHEYESYESCAAGLSTPLEQLGLIPEWEDRIHIVSSHICEGLIDFFCAQGTKWCHWSEAPGIRLMEIVGYRMRLFRLLNPLMLKNSSHLFANLSSTRQPLRTTDYPAEDGSRDLLFVDSPQSLSSHGVRQSHKHLCFHHLLLPLQTYTFCL